MQKKTEFETETEERSVLQNRNGRRKKEEKDLTWWQMILLLVLTLAVGLFLRNYVMNTYLVRGGSMQETLHNGEVMFVLRAHYKLGADVERGDVITLRIPSEEHDLVKRVIGLPGETVRIEAGTVYIDGVPLDEPYLTYVGSDWMEPVTLGDTQIFVLGDNRVNSKDSRVFGPVEMQDIHGEALCVLFPISRWGASLHGN